MGFLVNRVKNQKCLRPGQSGAFCRWSQPKISIKHWEVSRSPLRWSRCSKIWRPGLHFCFLQVFLDICWKEERWWILVLLLPGTASWQTLALIYLQLQTRLWCFMVFRSQKKLQPINHRWCFFFWVFWDQEEVLAEGRSEEANFQKYSNFCSSTQKAKEAHASVRR